MRFNCVCIIQGWGRGNDAVKILRELKKKTKNGGDGQKIVLHPMKERWYYFQFADCCWFREQLVLEEEPAFPRDDSLDLTSSRESGCEESQERLLGAGWPRLLADYSLLFLFCKLLRGVNILEEWEKAQGVRGAECVWRSKRSLGKKSEGVFQVIW